MNDAFYSVYKATRTLLEEVLTIPADLMNDMDRAFMGDLNAILAHFDAKSPEYFERLKNDNLD